MKKQRFLVAAIVLILAMTTGERIMPDSMAHAVQFESQTEKQTNFKQQALGGLFNQWTFDAQKPDEVPPGFSSFDLGEGPAAMWRIALDADAPTKPNVLRASSSCRIATCYRLIVADGFEYEYPDVTVRLQQSGGAPTGRGGVVFSVKNGKNFYAVEVDLLGKMLDIIRVIDGKETVLGRGEIKAKEVAWHTLRVQRNTIISKDFIETFFDGQLVASVEDQALGIGRVGLMIRGETSLSFDNLHAIPLFSQRPVSPPAAY